MNIGIFTNPEKDLHMNNTMMLRHQLILKGASVFLTQNCVDIIKNCWNDVIEDGPITTNVWTSNTKLDLIIVLGGDGTFLGVAREYAHLDIPILGFNMGHLGYLTEQVHGYNTLDFFNSTLAGHIVGQRFKIEERMMLEANIVNKEEKGIVKQFVALNDIVISRGQFMKIIDCSVKVNGDLAGDYKADGVLVSTPTGSTAYNLSAGGPIMQPTARMMAITPICAHSVSLKPFIAFESDIIEISSEDHCVVVTDGQEQFEIAPTQMVEIRKSQYTTKIAKFSDKSCFDIYRERIGNR